MPEFSLKSFNLFHNWIVATFFIIVWELWAWLFECKFEYYVIRWTNIFESDFFSDLTGKKRSGNGKVETKHSYEWFVALNLSSAEVSLHFEGLSHSSVLLCFASEYFISGISMSFTNNIIRNLGYNGYGYIGFRIYRTHFYVISSR